ncbi:gas vesicle protein GvpJ [Bradyrhizobium liaoningense]
MTTVTLVPEPDRAGAARSNGQRLDLAEALDRILHCGVSLQGELTIGVADVELLFLDLRLLLGSVDTIWPDGRPSVSGIGPRQPPAPAPSDDAMAALPAPSGNTADEAPVAAGRNTPSLQSRGVADARSSTAQGLVRLVLTLVKLLHEVIERQALRRMESGRLTDAQVENVGEALFAQAEEILRLQRQFGFSDQDVSLDLALPEGAP